MEIETRIRIPIAIALGAIPGALMRYYVIDFIIGWLGKDFPYGTMIVNITGALVMGFFITFIVEKNLNYPELSFLVATGFLGSYTTFSTYALDTYFLLKEDKHLFGLLYWLGSAILGVIALEIGVFIAKKL